MGVTFARLQSLGRTPVFKDCANIKNKDLAKLSAQCIKTVGAIYLDQGIC